MEALLPLGMLAAASVGLVYSTKKRQESFATWNQFQEYTEAGGKRYNPLMNLANPLKNTLLPVDYTQKDIEKAQSQSQSALQGIKAVPSDPTYDIETTDASHYKINDGRGAALNAIRMCETVRISDCSKFDDPAFQNNCGVCFEDGKDSLGKGTLGGLYISEFEKVSAEEYAEKMKQRDPLYTPTVGSCKPGRFVTTKQQCIRLQNKLNCEKKQNFTVPGCSQCSQDNTFTYVDDRADRTDASIVIVGTGVVNATIASTRETKTITLGSSPQTVSFRQFQEGDILYLNVQETDNTPVSLAGYLIGNTATGVYLQDIVPLVLTDGVTNSRPRLSGSAEIGQNYYTVMKPGKGKTSMRLTLQNPFTFISASEEEASLCPAAPYNSSEASVRLLNNSVCYKKGQVPGQYSQECLTNLFESAGCTSKGDKYPNTREKQQELLYDSNGNKREVGDIADYVTAIYNSASTGTSANGQPLSISTWDSYSMQCFGKQIKSPCDQYTSTGQPLGADCLSYLWKNKGATDAIPGGLGSTYTGPTSIASLEKFTTETPRYCTDAGTMAPIDAYGNVNQQAVQYAQSLGSVDAVKRYYDTLSKRANDNTLSDNDRKKAVEQCYGAQIPNEYEKSYQALPTRRNYMEQSSLFGPTSGQRTEFRDPNLCQIVQPRGEDVNMDTDRLAPRAGKPLLDNNRIYVVVNESQTDKMMLWSNMGTIPRGSTLRVAYIQKSPDAPAVLRAFINTSTFSPQRGPYYEIPSGSMRTFTMTADTNDWYFNYGALQTRVEPFEYDDICSVDIATLPPPNPADLFGGVTSPSRGVFVSPRWTANFRIGAFIVQPFIRPFYFSYQLNPDTNVTVGLTTQPGNVGPSDGRNSMLVSFSGGMGTQCILWGDNCVKQFYGVSPGTVLKMVYNPATRQMRYYQDANELIADFIHPKIPFPCYLQVLFGQGSIRNLTYGYL